MKLIDHLVNRFLGWKLPEDFHPDNHISINRDELAKLPEHCWPVGTNLFTADQARKMFEYCLAAAPTQTEQTEQAVALEKPPCDCIQYLNGYAHPDCACANSGDLMRTQDWCTRYNMAANARPALTAEHTVELLRMAQRRIGHGSECTDHSECKAIAEALRVRG